MAEKPSVINVKGGMMTKAYQFLGKIINFQQKKVYSKNKPEYFHQPYYKLEVLTSDQRTKDLYVFANLLKNQQIWPAIAQAQCLNKKYLFFYQRGRMNATLLVDWKELTDSFSQKGSGKELNEN